MSGSKRLTGKLSMAVILCCGLTTAAISSTSVDFKLNDLRGNPVQMSDFLGKWVVVNYWATWCAPCREEMPELDSFYHAHKDTDAVVLGVNLEDIEREALRRFVRRFSIGYPILIGGTESKSALGPIPGMPTTYIVSPKGEVVTWQIGGITRDLLERFLASRKR